MTDETQASAAKRMLSGKAWEDFCEQLKLTGRMIEQFGDTVDELDRVEWYRFLTRLMRHGVERFVENVEADRPRLRDQPWRQAINFQSPDQDHLIAGFRDGRHEYKIIGNRGTIPYFVMASWKAPMPADAGARDWSSRGVEGLAEFDPAMLQTTAFLQSDSIHFDAEGNFSVIVSREKPTDGSDWLPMDADCAGVLVRNVYHLREQTIPPSMRIERIDGSGSRPIRPAETSDGLAKAGQLVLGYGELVRSWWQDNLGKRPNRIRFSRAVYLANGGVADRHHGFGTWECAGDEALVVQFMPTPCDYWILQLCNMWQENLDNYEDGGGYVQKYRAVTEHDGSVRIVVATHNPRIGGNWIDPFGHVHGGWNLRLIKTRGEPPPVTVHRLKTSVLEEKGLAALDGVAPIVSGEITD